jgi:hypothetical protein
VGSLIFSSAEAHAVRDKCCFVSLTANPGTGLPAHDR